MHHTTSGAESAHVEEKKVCRECRHEVTADELVTKRERVTGESVHFHSACWTAYEQKLAAANEAAEKRRHREDLERKLSRLRASLDASIRGPAGAWGEAMVPFPRSGARLTDERWRKGCHNKILNAWETYRPDEHHTMLVLGPTGAGKTTGIEAWVHAEYDRRAQHIEATGEERVLRFVYVTGQDLAGCVRRSELGREAPLLSAAKRTLLLFIDEVGYEPESPDRELFAVVDHRDRAALPTVVCSGLTLEKFDARYGGALRRRLVERGLLVNAYPRNQGQVRSVG